MRKTTVSKLISGSFYIAFMIFIVLYIKKLDFNVLKDIKFSKIYILVTIVVSILARFYGSFLWLQILKGLGAEVHDYLGLNYVYAKSWLGRYIPGKVTWILGKIYFASEHGISKKKLGVSSLLEGSLQVLVAFLLGGTLLLLTDGLEMISWEVKVFLLIFCLFIFFLLLPPVFNRFIKLAYWIFRKKELESEHLISAKLIIKSSILFSIGMVINGFSYFFLAKSIYNLPFSRLPYYIGVTNVASAIGIATIIAPSGIGIRESVQILLLNAIMPKEIVLVIAVVSRIWGLIMDVLYFLMSKCLPKHLNFGT